MGKKYKNLYRKIWNRRKKFDEGSGEYYVECALTGKKIYRSDLTVHNFSHIKTKRLHDPYDEENIEIWSEDAHRYWHNKGREKFNEKYGTDY